MTHLFQLLSIRSLLVVGLSVALWSSAGCQSESRSTTTDEGYSSSGAESGKSGMADAMLDSDTERARAAIEANQQAPRDKRPSAPRNRRSGARVVDQPRVGPTVR